MAATMVGQPGDVLRGSDGADVIVSNGAQEVQGAGGDDLICLTGGTIYASDGTGDDIVDDSANTAVGGVVVLMAGDDTFYGSPLQEQVYMEDGGADRVTMGGGDDLVFHDDRGFVPSDPAADGDAISLGSGADTLVADDVGPGSTLHGGSGKDIVELPFDTRGPLGDWVYDVRTGVTRNGEKVVDWDGFESYYLAQYSHSALFRGDDGRQLVEVYGAGSPTRVLLGGGDDVIAASLAYDGLTVAGGAGEDTFQAVAEEHGPHRLLADLGRGTVQGMTYAGKAVGSAHVAGIEDVVVDLYSRVELIGNGRANRLRLLQHCGPARLEGRGGDDVLQVDQDLDEPDCPGVHASGGLGDDRLVGSGYDDVLVGGAGKDLADGRDGRDRCVAEGRLSCEVRGR